MQQQKTKKTAKITLGKSDIRADSDARRMFIMLEQTRTAIYHMLIAEEKLYNTDFTEVGIMYYLLNKENGAPQSDLAKWVMKKQNSISVCLNKMEKKGLIKKVKNRKDRKKYSILTPKGRNILKQLEARGIALTFSVLSEEEKRQLKPILEKLCYRSGELLGLSFKPPYLP
jgi:DNA-binding MarR family transcriptional regulator